MSSASPNDALQGDSPHCSLERNPVADRSMLHFGPATHARDMTFTFEPSTPEPTPIGVSPCRSSHPTPAQYLSQCLHETITPENDPELGFSSLRLSAKEELCEFNESEDHNTNPDSASKKQSGPHKDIDVRFLPSGIPEFTPKTPRAFRAVSNDVLTPEPMSARAKKASETLERDLSYSCTVAQNAKKVLKLITSPIAFADPHSFGELGFVYAFRDDELGLVKIGHALDVQQRKSRIEKDCKISGGLTCIARSGPMLAFKLLESIMHRDLAPHRRFFRCICRMKPQADTLSKVDSATYLVTEEDTRRGNEEVDTSINASHHVNIIKEVDTGSDVYIRHKEYFKIDDDTVKRTLGLWTRFVGSYPWVQHPHGDPGLQFKEKSNLKTHWLDLLNPRSTTVSMYEAKHEDHDGRLARWHKILRFDEHEMETRHEKPYDNCFAPSSISEEQVLVIDTSSSDMAANSIESSAEAIKSPLVQLTIPLQSEYIGLADDATSPVVTEGQTLESMFEPDGSEKSGDILSSDCPVDSSRAYEDYPARSETPPSPSLRKMSIAHRSLNAQIVTSWTSSDNESHKSVVKESAGVSTPESEDRESGSCRKAIGSKRCSRESDVATPDPNQGPYRDNASELLEDSPGLPMRVVDKKTQPLTVKFIFTDLWDLRWPLSCLLLLALCSSYTPPSLSIVLWGLFLTFFVSEIRAWKMSL